MWGLYPLFLRCVIPFIPLCAEFQTQCRKVDVKLPSMDCSTAFVTCPNGDIAKSLSRLVPFNFDVCMPVYMLELCWVLTASKNLGIGLKIC